MNTRQVGGGNATPVANDFNTWLGSQLTGTTDPYAGARQALQGAVNSGGRFAGVSQDALNRLPAPTSTGSPSEFQTLFQNLAAGNQDPSGGFAALQNMIQNPQQAQQFQNPYNAPQFQNANLAQLMTNFGQGQTGMANVGNVAQSNANVTQGMGTQATSSMTPEIQSMIAQMFGGGGINAGAGNVGFNSNVRLDPAANIDYDSPEIQAIAAQSNRQLGQSAADLRARFGAEGAGALGTGAQFAEAELRAAAAPQMTRTIADVIRQQQQQDLAERSSRAGVNLQSDGQNLQAAIASAGNATNLQSLLGNQNIAALNAGLGMRGQDFTNQAQNRGLDVSQMGLGMQQSIANMNAGLTQRGQDITNQGIGNQFQVGAQGLNNQAGQWNNQNSLQSALQGNNFNLSNAQNDATFQNNTNVLNQQGEQQAFQNNLNTIIAGMNQGNFNSQQGMQLLNMLFGGLMQSNQLGTPQSQIAVTPSAANQFLQGGMDLGRLFMPMMQPSVAAGMPSGGMVNPVMMG